MSKVKVATVWLDGCSGCHMSFLDIDERILALAEKIEFVYSPIVDMKVIPEGIDVAIIEGAIGNEEDVHKVKQLRKNSKVLISLGDCAVTSNVPGMRNSVGAKAALTRAFIENCDVNPQIPTQGVPTLLEQCVPVHQVVKVDVFIPGCPPSADTIYTILVDLLNGKDPDITNLTRFGA